MRKKLLSMCMVLAVATTLLSCDNGNLPTSVNPGSDISSVVISPDPIRLEAGSQTVLKIRAYEESGREVPGPFITTWSSNNESIARVTQTGHLSTLIAGTTKVRAEIDGISTEAALTVLPRIASEILILPREVRVETGDSVIFQATVKDSAGTVLPNHPIQWNLVDPSIGEINSSGVLLAKAEGTTVVKARSGAAQSEALATFTWGPLHTLEISPSIDTLFVGGSRKFVALPKDKGGNTLPTRRIGWETSNTSLLSVDTAGLARAWKEGRARITARQDTILASADVEILPAEGITLMGVSPSPMVSGKSATLTGVNLAANISDVSLSVDGQTAAITSVSETEIRFTVPTMPEPCTPTRNVVIGVQIEGAEARAGTIEHPLASSPFLSLSPGEDAVFLPSDRPECLELAANGGEYRINIFNASSSGSSTITAGISGSTGFAQSSESSSAPAGVASTVSSFAGPALSSWAAAKSLEEHEHDTGLDLHSRILEQNREIASRLPLKSQVSTSSGLSRLSSLNAAPAVGDEVVVNFPSLSNLCSADLATEVKARVVYSGNTAVVLEDKANSTSGGLNSTYEALGREFENDMLPVLIDNFGDPLAYDSELDNNGRILMLFTDEVTRAGGGQIAGFVTSADFHSTEACGASNEAEIFYAKTPAGTSGIEEWHRGIRSTVLHEVKHLTSYAERYSRSSGSVTLEERWLEESTAMVSEEIWARSNRSISQFGNADYRSSIYCEPRATSDPACKDVPKVFLDHFYFLWEYYKDADTRSPLYTGGNGDNSFYGSGWQLVRWATDTYGTSERSFLSSLTQEANKSGLDNLLSASGNPTFASMIADYTLAMAVDDNPFSTPRRSELTIPSWNTRDIFKGLYEDYINNSSVFTAEFPLKTHSLNYGTFEAVDGAARGGSAIFYHLKGTQSATQMLKFFSGTTAGLPATAGVAIYRLK